MASAPAPFTDEVRLKTSAAIALSLLALNTNISAAGNWAPTPAGSPVGLMQRLDRASWIAAG
jgi:hypothetical protein